VKNGTRTRAVISVRYVLLALLSEGPSCGALLRAEFASATGEVRATAPHDELATKVELALRVSGTDVREMVQVHRRYLVEQMQRWSRIKQGSAGHGLRAALAVDAELFRLDSLVRWLDAADGHLERAEGHLEPAEGHLEPAARPSWPAPPAWPGSGASAWAPPAQDGSSPED
jgi:hypothetical protein